MLGAALGAGAVWLRMRLALPAERDEAWRGGLSMGRTQGRREMRADAGRKGAGV